MLARGRRSVKAFPSPPKFKCTVQWRYILLQLSALNRGLYELLQIAVESLINAQQTINGLP